MQCMTAEEATKLAYQTELAEGAVDENQRIVNLNDAYAQIRFAASQKDAATAGDRYSVLLKTLMAVNVPYLRSTGFTVIAETHPDPDGYLFPRTYYRVSWPRKKDDSTACN